MDFRDIKEFFIDASKYLIVIVIILVLVIYVISLQQVVGPSMQPTLKDGDILLLSKVHYVFFGVERNDVVALSYDDSKFLIKRIIGLPGEKIEYKDNILYIDDKAYTENIYEGMITDDFKLSDLGHETIPEDMYLVLGDNRGDSLDSRDIGLIPKEDIIGKTLIKIWPLNEFKVIE